jgi:AcrR family transcriptional regulator
MRRSAHATRTKILTAGYRLLYEQGFSRVSMDAIADAAGITKRTLYQHFPSKDGLVAAMLEHHRSHAISLIQSWGDAPASTPIELTVAIFSGLKSWASERKWLSSGFTRLTMELADLPGHPARKAAHLHKQEVEDWLLDSYKRFSLNSPERLAKQIALLIEGCLSLVLIHRDTSYIDDASEAAMQLVKSKEP